MPPTHSHFPSSSSARLRSQPAPRAPSRSAFPAPQLVAAAPRHAGVPTILPEAIARRAYEKFLQRSCAPGGENEDWLAAEQELIVEAQSH